MKKKFKAYLPIIAGVVLIVAALMIFLPSAIKQTTTLLGVTNVEEYYGLFVVFGHKEDPALKFNFGAFLGWVLLLGAGVICLIGALNRKLGILVLLAGNIAAVGAVLVLFTATFFRASNNLISGENLKYTIGVGPILGGIFGLIGAAAADYAGVKALMSKK
ncbi:MAG: hypothetical protein ACOX3K_03205 [Bacilli bacterium]